MVHRGLRQGDRLTHFLFLIVAEGLGGLMREAIRQKKFIEAYVESEAINISLFQFVTTLFFVNLHTRTSSI